MVRYLVEKLSMFPQLWRGPITFRTESSLAVGKPRELVIGGRTKGGSYRSVVWGVWYRLGKESATELHLMIECDLGCRYGCSKEL